MTKIEPTGLSQKHSIIDPSGNGHQWPPDHQMQLSSVLMLLLFSLSFKFIFFLWETLLPLATTLHLNLLLFPRGGCLSFFSLLCLSSCSRLQRSSFSLCLCLSTDFKNHLSSLFWAKSCPPQKCRGLNPLYLWMWSYLTLGSLQIIKLRWGPLGRP